MVFKIQTTGGCGFPHLLLKQYFRLMASSCEDYSLERCLKPFPDATCPKEESSDCNSPHISFLYQQDRSFELIGLRLPVRLLWQHTVEFIGDEHQAFNLRQSEFLDLHDCTFRDRHLHSSITGCPLAPLSQPQLLQAACLNKACGELRLASEAQLRGHG